MTEAEKLFNQIFMRWRNREGFILSFRRTSFTAITAATTIIKEENTHFVDQMMRGPDFDKLFLDKAGFCEVMPPAKIVESMTQMTLSQAQVAVDAASIVFANSFIDGAALDYCRVTALVAPRDWESVLDQRQIKLSDLRESNYDQILRTKLDEFFGQLERESLLKKIDHLFARCRPPEKWSPMHDYVFDRERLERLDRYRHDVIHGNGPVQELAGAEDEVDYLMRLVLFLQGLVNLRYGLRLEPFYALTGKERPPVDS
jgi:hypothetical protein